MARKAGSGEKWEKKGKQEEGSVSNSPGKAGPNFDSNVHDDGKFAKKGRKEAGSVSDKGDQKAEASHDVDFAEGGHSNHMFGEQEAGEADAGETGKPDERGPGQDFASGGKTKMFGFMGSVPARDGITSSR